MGGRGRLEIRTGRRQIERGSGRGRCRASFPRPRNPPERECGRRRRDDERRCDHEPERAAPDVVRALVGAGADVIEVRAEQSSLEQVYFEVMGVRPGAGGEAT